MEKLNTICLSVKTLDKIENLLTTIYQGEAQFDGYNLQFNVNDESYFFTKMSRHLLNLNHQGQMSYDLDLKMNQRIETELVVDGYQIPIESKCIALEFNDHSWTIEYQIYQNDALLFHNEITIEFLMN